MTSAVVALRDLQKSIVCLPLALRLAVDDIETKYRRTVLGPFWIALAQAATIVGFTLVFSGLFRASPPDYALFIAAGLPTWTLISTHLTDMPAALVTVKGYIESYEVPWLTHIWRRSFQYLIIFGHQIITFAVLVVVLRAPVSVEILLVIPGLLIVTVAGVGMGIFLAVLGARYRDLQHAMSMISALLFFMTPVIWRATQLVTNEWIYIFNPLYYLASVVRDPLLGHAPSAEVWVIACAFAVAFFVIGVVIFSWSRRRLYHWL